MSLKHRPTNPNIAEPATARGGIRFDRNELAGAFGDIGTDLPLIVGVILAAHLDSASALVLFQSRPLRSAPELHGFSGATELLFRRLLQR